MTTKNATAPQRQDIEALLPWHAAGTLNRRDAERVEAALANDNELKRQYEMVREELGETIRLNETLGAPSARAMERLMSAIEADVATARKPRMWSATAAALAIVLQAGLIAGLYVEGGEKTGKGFQTASYPTQTETLTRGFSQGSFVLVRFAPTATAAEIAKYLETNKLGVVDGPRAGGLYKIKVAPTSLAREEIGRIAKRIQDDSKVVSFAAPTE
jgi:hypothetical protein